MLDPTDKEPEGRKTQPDRVQSDASLKLMFLFVVVVGFFVCLDYFS